MELTESQIYEAMGIAEPAAEGEKGQEPAQPTDIAEEAEGEKEQEVAEPAAEGGNGQEVAEPAQESTTDNDPTLEKQEMSGDDRREQAAKRRRAEMQAAIDRARQEERAAMDQELQAVLELAGLSDQETGAPITTMEDFRKYRQGQKLQKLQSELWDGEIRPETLNEAIEDNPAVRAARELIEHQERERAAAEAAEREKAFQAKVDAELAEIHKLDDSVSTLGDLLAMPNGQEFYALVQRGYSFYDAYCCVNRDRLYQKVRQSEQLRAAEAARQQAVANARGKNHLNASPLARGAGADSVPKDEMALFKLLNPGASEAEIQAYYNKSKAHH